MSWGFDEKVDKSDNVVGYIYSTFTESLLDSTSTLIYIFMFPELKISHLFYVQSIAMLSTFELEYYDISDAGQVIVYLQYLLAELGFQIMPILVILNTAHLRNFEFLFGIKYIDMQFYLICKVSIEDFHIVNIPIAKMTDNNLTKMLPAIGFLEFYFIILYL